MPLRAGAEPVEVRLATSLEPSDNPAYVPDALLDGIGGWTNIRNPEGGTVSTELPKSGNQAARLSSEEEQYRATLAFDPITEEGLLPGQQIRVRIAFMLTDADSNLFFYGTPRADRLVGRECLFGLVMRGDGRVMVHLPQEPGESVDRDMVLEHTELIPGDYYTLELRLRLDQAEFDVEIIGQNLHEEILNARFRNPVANRMEALAFMVASGTAMVDDIEVAIIE